MGCFNLLWLGTFIQILLFSPGVYGDVQRVKILFNKKDSALVQMREPAQAQLGKHINKLVSPNCCTLLQ